MRDMRELLHTICFDWDTDTNQVFRFVPVEYDEEMNLLIGPAMDNGRIHTAFAENVASNGG